MLHDFKFDSKIPAETLSDFSKPIPGFPSEKGDGLEETLGKCLSSHHTPCKPCFFIAPIPCGGGKSRTVQTFIRNWKERGFAGGGSVIIMLGTYAEVNSYISGCELSRVDYACFSKKAPYVQYGLGHSAAGRARS